MNLDHVRFVAAWTLAPSLEVASAILGMAPESVIRQVEWMRSAGVPLKEMYNGSPTNNIQVVPPSDTKPHVEQVAGPAEQTDQTEQSYVAQLRTAAQMQFYARYTVGKDGNPSIAECVAERRALKSGDLGRAGIASGLVENAAFEAVAQLAVSPPPGFDQNHKRADGFVVRHIQNAVRTILNRQFGWNGKRFGGYVPTDAEGTLIEPVGRELAPPERPNDIELAQVQAHEAERARQLEQVRAALPGAIPADRAGRIAILQCFGMSKTQALKNAAEHRFYIALAKHIRPALDGAPRHTLGDAIEQRGQGGPTNRQPELSADRVPSRIHDFPPPTQPKSRQQREAERFVIAWERSSTAHEAARKLGKSARSVVSYAAYLRAAGVTNLKHLPTTPGPLVRGVRALVPSCN